MQPLVIYRQQIELSQFGVACTSILLIAEQRVYVARKWGLYVHIQGLPTNSVIYNVYTL